MDQSNTNPTTPITEPAPIPVETPQVTEPLAIPASSATSEVKGVSMPRPERFILWEGKLIKDSPVDGVWVWGKNSWERWGGSVWREEGEVISEEEANAFLSRSQAASAPEPIAPVEPAPAPVPPAPTSPTPPAESAGKPTKTDNAIQRLLTKAKEKIQFRKQAKLEKIMVFAKAQGGITNDQAQKLLRVSDATATRYLAQLTKSGRLRLVGKSKAARYILAQ